MSPLHFLNGSSIDLRRFLYKHKRLNKNSYADAYPEREFSYTSIHGKYAMTQEQILQKISILKLCCPEKTTTLKKSYRTLP